MTIIHSIDDFLFILFPEIDRTDEKQIIEALTEYYTFSSFVPNVNIKDGFAYIEISTDKIIEQENTFNKVVELCEKGKYNEAKPLLEQLIKTDPTNSEYYRIRGQIYSDEGQQDEAINYLIDALKWDPKNGWALLMMGNIFAKFKDDVDTAMKYYDQALKVNPNDNISINNIGANLMQQGKLNEAARYFLKALEIDSNYPNTYFALGMIESIKGNDIEAFNYTIEALKKNNNKNDLYKHSLQQAFEIGKKYDQSNKEIKILKQYLSKLEVEGNKLIDIIEDETIPTAAKLELAENYNRPKHIVRYKESYPAVDHLIMHELGHLDLVNEARKKKVNQLFVSTEENKKSFIKSLGQSIKYLNKQGYSEKIISNVINDLFDGLNRQIFNTPIDLFIENKLYNDFPELRPIQFISLFNIIQEGIKAVTDKEIVRLAPKSVLSYSKIYNIVTSLQFNDLFGVDLLDQFKGTQAEIKQAQEFFNEFLEYKEDNEPAEEYELVKHWAEDLKIDYCFELIDEDKYRKRKDIDSFLTSIENDPFGLDDDKEFKEKQIDQFNKTQSEIGTNMAVVMFMVDALKYFENKPINEIKEIAFEIAMQGTMGYSPDKDGYLISKIPNKSFSGYHILAYYYVSWAIAIPEMLSEIKLPYDDEYKLAKQLYNKNE